MNEKVWYTGGEPDINIGDVTRDSGAIKAALFGLVKAWQAGDDTVNFIISGCEVTVTAGVGIDITAGYIFLNGEILQVDAQSVAEGASGLYAYEKQITYDPDGDKTYNDSVARQTWRENRGVAVNVTTVPSDMLNVFGYTILSYLESLFDALYVPQPDALDIGVWNMDGTDSVSILHGITDFTTIKNVEVNIYNDNADQIYKLNCAEGGTISWDADYIILTRMAGGVFDLPAFNDAVMNRGKIFIAHS